MPSGAGRPREPLERCWVESVLGQDHRNLSGHGSRSDLGVADQQHDLDERAAFDERTAILEYDGGFARAEAETQAAEEFPELPPFLRRVQ